MISMRSNHSDNGRDVEEVMTTYQRVAQMDPPALGSLAGELQRISVECFASAVLQAGPAAQARARRAAQRVAAAHEALASVETEGRAEHR